MTAVYGVTAAAEICGVSIRTIQRHRAQLEASGAWRDRRGQWQIPVTALAAVGFRPGRPGRPDVVSRLADGESPDTATVDAELAAMRLRAEVAEARVAGLERVIEAQERTLRQLESGGRRAPEPERPPPPPQGPLAFLRNLF